MNKEYSQRNVAEASTRKRLGTVFLCAAILVAASATARAQRMLYSGTEISEKCFQANSTPDTRPNSPGNDQIGAEGFRGIGLQLLEKDEGNGGPESAWATHLDEAQQYRMNWQLTPDELLSFKLKAVTPQTTAVAIQFKVRPENSSPGSGRWFGYYAVTDRSPAVTWNDAGQDTVEKRVEPKLQVGELTAFTVDLLQDVADLDRFSAAENVCIEGLWIGMTGTKGQAAVFDTVKIIPKSYADPMTRARSMAIPALCDFDSRTPAYRVKGKHEVLVSGPSTAPGMALALEYGTLESPLSVFALHRLRTVWKPAQRCLAGFLFRGDGGDCRELSMTVHCSGGYRFTYVFAETRASAASGVRPGRCLEGGRNWDGREYKEWWVGLQSHWLAKPAAVWTEVAVDLAAAFLAPVAPSPPNQLTIRRIDMRIGGIYETGRLLLDDITDRKSVV